MARDADAPEREPRPPLDLRALLWRMVGALTGLAVLGLAAGLLVREQVHELGTAFVEQAGPWGIAAAFFVPDAFALPIPPEPFMALGLAGGIPFWQIVVFGSAGSIAGGCVAFGLSRIARRIPWVDARLADRAIEVEAIVKRYGVLALVLGALTPLPYSLMAWAAGVLGMRFPMFLTVSLLRIVRVAAYLLPIALGWGAG